MANIMISRDGKQLGPLTMEAARSLVLTGAINATDWAWIDGSADWIPLNQVPGFIDAPRQQPTEQKSPPAEKATIVAQTPRTAQAAPQNSEQEQILWKGSPSQMLNLGFYVNSFITLLVLGILGFSKWADTAQKDVILPMFSASLVVLLIWGIVRFIQVAGTRYVVTTQRVKVFRGILSKDVQEIELFRVKDTSAHQTFLLRMFGIGNVRILSGDTSSPNLLLLAIPKPFELRERLRNEVLVLRQRFKVRELDMM